jgi:hypothetical protein
MAVLKLAVEDRDLFIELKDALLKLEGGIQQKSESDEENTRQRGQSEGSLTTMLNKLSFGIPGTGIRLFGLGDFLTQLKKAKGPLERFTVGLGMGVTALTAFNEGLAVLARQLGGTTQRQALGFGFGAAGQMIGINDGLRLRGPGGAARAVRGAGQIAGEFGGLVSPQAAARFGDLALDLGVSTNDLTRLTRLFQANILGTEAAINQFRQVGIGGTVAATELAKSGDAVARAGGEFNKFIVRGIANAKKLGLEFSEIDKNLTGFATDFEGTVEGFAQLRAVLPGFAVDFGQLMSVALTGTTEEYTDLIRTGLVGAGVGVNTQLRRDQAGIIRQMTGFSADQVQRIVDNQEVDFDFKVDLDTKRNSLLQSQITILMSILGAVGGAGGSGLVTAGATSALALSNPKARAGAAGVMRLGSKWAMRAGIAGLIAGGLAYGATELFMDDFVYRPGKPPIPFNPKDTIVGVKNPASLGGGVDTNALAGAMAGALNGITVEMRDLDKAIMRLPEGAIRNA